MNWNNCENCKKPIIRKYLSSSKRRRYCSRICFNIVKKILHSGTCKKQGCNDPIFISKLCKYHYGRMRRYGDNSNHPANGPFKGIHRKQGEGSVSKFGYKVFAIGNKQIREHRFIMEKFLGRSLDCDEDVHHINGNKIDNRIENLQVIKRSDHMKLHRKEEHIKKLSNPDYKKWCPSRGLDSCKICKTREIKHGGLGMCTRCYDIKRGHSKNHKVISP